MSEHDKGGFREGAEGTVEGVKGKAKEAAGSVFGNDQLREEGRAQQDRADHQRDAARREAEAEKERTQAELEEQRQRAHQRGQS
ncbi:CsbD family protein [Nocardia sp. 2]|uniref:CsbD family protein n=1 Tax=Nocardia acididurans TaxID=2802282 RepID=A0ABS1M0T1_9NOCA|nr:CsbD family protein [Nocardia acididurans]MBL1074135.1 CsbD family protein [Nocardia acididurans]